MRTATARNATVVIHRSLRVRTIHEDILHSYRWLPVSCGCKNGRASKRPTLRGFPPPSKSFLYPVECSTEMSSFVAPRILNEVALWLDVYGTLCQIATVSGYQETESQEKHTNAATRL